MLNAICRTGDRVFYKQFFFLLSTSNDFVIQEFVITGLSSLHSIAILAGLKDHS